MPFAELTFALLAILLTPGPTNTLLALAGSEAGARRAIRLIPAELAAYLLTTIPLAVVGAKILVALPELRTMITAAAAIWVAWLAISLWRLPRPVDGNSPEAITFSRVFLTTLLNPKALIIGLVLLPSETSLAPRVLLFAGLIIVVASVWACFGSMLSSRETPASPVTLPLVRRIGSCWLGLLSLGIIAAGMRG